MAGGFRPTWHGRKLFPLLVEAMRA